MTMMIWGMTFVFTKVLLRSFSPVEILVFRFMIGLFALFLLNPRPLKLRSRSHEWYFAGIGLTGITLYFLLENIALTYTYASNVGVITSLTPFSWRSVPTLSSGMRSSPCVFWSASWLPWSEFC